MRASDLADALSEVSAVPPALQEWARTVAGSDEHDNQSELRELHQITRAEGGPYDEVFNVVSACELARWGSNDDSSRSERRDVVAGLNRCSDRHGHDPFLGRWLAEGALELASELSPAWATEMHALAWRMGLTGATLPPAIAIFYLERLTRTANGALGVVLDAQLAPVRIALVRRLATLMPVEATPLLRLVQVGCYATLAVHVASEGRRQLTLYYTEFVENMVQELAANWSQEAFTEADQELLEAVNLWWRPSYAAEPALVAADALMNLGEPARALGLLQVGVDIGTDGDTDAMQLRLIQSILRRCWGLTKSA